MSRIHFIIQASLAVAFTFLGPGWADSGRGMNRKLYAVPPPGQVTIDGALADWDWSGAIETYDRAETRATQSAQCAVMYDADALYIAAKVKDSSPMMNLHNPAADADKAWMGDCLQFRLVTNRELPFPFLRGALGSAEQMGREVGQPLHLMLWYYTKDKEPALQIHTSMGLDPVRDEWAPHGVVPKTHFEGAYRVDDDRQGYTFEYRIPWETLNAKDFHPRAGDVVTATLQFLWDDGSGLAHRVSAYDLMAQAGFPWQETQCWGKLIFADRNDIPRSWVEPYQKPEPPMPLTFSYDLPADGEVSVALYDEENRIVRHIVAQAPRQAGAVTDKWDGRDSRGKDLPVGEYAWRGLYHGGITTRYVMSIGNSGQPAWKTADGTGGWGGDYGHPSCAAVAGDRLILGWTGHEAGWGIIATDLNGKKIWGLGHKNASIMATDGKRFFANGEKHGEEINVYAVESGQPMIFGNGRQGLEPPAGGDAAGNRPTGVAYADGQLYVSLGARDLVGVYDADSGELKTTWPIAKPGRLAPTTDGAVLVISDQAVVRVVDGKATAFATEHLDAPAGVAVGPDGAVYVANQGKLQNVSVFAADGAYRHSIGKPGGRPPVGTFDASGMLQPGGIVVDGEGKLWVPETNVHIKRVSVWNTETRDLATEFFGACSYSPFGWIDPANPNEAFFDNTIWSIDLEKGTWYPKATFYASQNANMIYAGAGGFFYPFRVFTANNGRQYAVSVTWAFGPVLWMREGDRFKPLHYRFRNHPNPVLCPRPPFAMMNDTSVYPPGKDYLWTDKNGDEEAQADELTQMPATPYFQWMDADLNLYGDGVIYRPTAVSDQGVPTYDFAKPEKQPATGQVWTDPKGSKLWSWHDNSHLSLFNADGTHQWTYTGLRNWRDALNVGSPGPGTLWGTTCPVGMVGRYTGLVSYFGTVDLVRDDGLFVAQVFEHPAKGNNGPHIFYVEFLAGQMVQPQGTDKIYILAGDQDLRVSEVIGLDMVNDLPGGTYRHTPEMAQQAAEAWAAYGKQVARGQSLVLARGGAPGLAVADPVGKKIDEEHGFQAKAAYDADNLYFHYSVTSPSELINQVVDPLTTFRGGNLLDIQISTDPQSDPDRKTPAPGDVRLLISRRDGKPWAVLLRPKVDGFTGERIKLTSPTGFEEFDSIAVTEQVELRNYRKTANGFTVTAVVPRDLVALENVSPGETLRLDVGYVFGNAGGTNAAQRAYWHNNSFTANVVNDIPHESRLEPAEWGEARIE